MLMDKKYIVASTMLLKLKHCDANYHILAQLLKHCAANHVLAHLINHVLAQLLTETMYMPI